MSDDPPTLRDRLRDALAGLLLRHNDGGRRRPYLRLYPHQRERVEEAVDQVIGIWRGETWSK